MTTIPTWSELRTAAETAGMPAEALEHYRRHTAPARHADRVRRTLEAVYAAIDATRPGEDADGRLILAYVMIDLDIGGLDRHDGRLSADEASTPPYHTDRMPWARGLGRGRWRAGDGAAWYAAARAAQVEVGAEIHTRGMRLHGADGQTEKAHVDCAAYEMPESLPWARVRAENQLRRLVREYTVATSGGPEADRFGPPAQLIESMEEWASMLRGLDRHEAEETAAEASL